MRFVAEISPVTVMFALGDQGGVFDFGTEIRGVVSSDTLPIQDCVEERALFVVVLRLETQATSSLLGHFLVLKELRLMATTDFVQWSSRRGMLSIEE